MAQALLIPRSKSTLAMVPSDVKLCSRSLSALVPLHFYGELVKTDEGRVILSCKGHLEQFADFIREFGLEDQNLEIISHLKSVLWAVVGS